MILRPQLGPIFLFRLAGGEEKCLKKRLQDTRRTPFRRKTVGFPWLHMGASVDERAARKEKASNFNASNGTIAHFAPEAPRL